MLYSYLITSHLSHADCVLTDGESHYTYKDIDNSCRLIVSNMTKLGVKRGDRVFLLDEHNIKTALTILACMRMGVCFIPLSTNCSDDVIRLLEEDATPVLIIGGHIHATTTHVQYESIFSKTSVLINDSEGFIDQDSLCYIIYTSGSTGTPKGVMAPEYKVKFCIDAINQRLMNSSSDRILCCLPLSFDYGLYQLFLSLSAESCLVLPPEIPFPYIITLLSKEHITGFPAMPTMLRLLLKSRLLQKVNLADLRYITSTGDSLPVDLIKQVELAIPSAKIIPMYGLTECKRVSIIPLDRRDKVLEGSCGLPLDGVNVLLENMDSSGVGELIVCGENVMDGYWRDADTTAKCFYLNSENKQCLRTGDLFRIDNDGYLYFVGRKKLILKVNGYRIGIIELEQKFCSIFDHTIEEVAIIGYPDYVSGEKICICVHSSLNPDEVVKQVKKAVYSLSSYQVPQILYLTKQSFPKNDNGKVDRTRLKRMAINDECFPII